MLDISRVSYQVRIARSERGNHELAHKRGSPLMNK